MTRMQDELLKKKKTNRSLVSILIQQTPTQGVSGNDRDIYRVLDTPQYAGQSTTITIPPKV